MGYVIFSGFAMRSVLVGAVQDETGNVWLLILIWCLIAGISKSGKETYVLHVDVKEKSRGVCGHQ